MRHFELNATAAGNGSTLIDKDTGLAIDGIERIEIVVQSNRATRLVITLIGEVTGIVETDHVEMHHASNAIDDGVSRDR